MREELKRLKTAWHNAVYAWETACEVFELALTANIASKSGRGEYDDRTSLTFACAHSARTNAYRVVRSAFSDYERCRKNLKGE